MFNTVTRLLHVMCQKKDTKMALVRLIFIPADLIKYIIIEIWKTQVSVVAPAVILIVECRREVIYTYNICDKKAILNTVEEWKILLNMTFVIKNNIQFYLLCLFNYSKTFLTRKIFLSYR